MKNMEIKLDVINAVVGDVLRLDVREVNLPGFGVVELGDTVVAEMNNKVRRRFEVSHIGDGFVLGTNKGFKTKAGELRKVRLSWEAIRAVEKPVWSLLGTLTASKPSMADLLESERHTAALDALGDSLLEYGLNGWAQFAAHGKSYTIGSSSVTVRAGVAHGTPSATYYDSELRLFWRETGSV